MYLSTGTVGRRVFNSKDSAVNLDDISTKNLWDLLNNIFIRFYNKTFDGYLILTQKTTNNELIENFYRYLKELFENFDLGEKEATIIRDVFYWKHAE